MPRNTLNLLPAEIRREIIKDVMATDSARALLAALRVTLFYSEALEFYYKFNQCVLSGKNQPEVEVLSSKTQLSVQMLKVNFSNVTTAHNPRRWGIRVKYAINTRTNTAVKTTGHEELTHTRIAPKPSVTTLSPFTNLRILRIDASVVDESRFHQVEAMVRLAASKYGQLERLEVRDDMANLQWEAMDQSGLRRTNNDGWVERFNAELGMPAKLLTVSNSGYMMVWCWAAKESKRLTWEK